MRILGICTVIGVVGVLACSAGAGPGAAFDPLNSRDNPGSAFDSPTVDIAGATRDEPKVTGLAMAGYEQAARAGGASGGYDVPPAQGDTAGGNAVICITCGGSIRCTGTVKGQSATVSAGIPCEGTQRQICARLPESGASGVVSEKGQTYRYQVSGNAVTVDGPDVSVRCVFSSEPPEPGSGNVKIGEGSGNGSGNGNGNGSSSRGDGGTSTVTQPTPDAAATEGVDVP